MYKRFVVNIVIVVATMERGGMPFTFPYAALVAHTAGEVYGGNGSPTLVEKKNEKKREKENVSQDP